MTEEDVQAWLVANDEVLKRAIAEIRRRVDHFISDWGKTYEFNAEHIDNARIKDAPRILAKAVHHDVEQPEDLLARCYEKDGRYRFPVHDLLGVRVLVLSLNDVTAVRAAVEALYAGSAADQQAGYDLGNREDHDLEDINEEPRGSGYRALHVDGSVTVRVSGTQYAVPFELQVKTLAQHVFGQHTHDESYVPDDANEDPRYELVQGLQRALAEQINSADLLLAQIERAAESVRDNIEALDAGENLTAAAVDVVFQKAYGTPLRLSDASDLARRARGAGLDTNQELADLIDPGGDSAAEFAAAFEQTEKRTPTDKETVFGLVRRLTKPDPEELLDEPPEPDPVDAWDPDIELASDPGDPQDVRDAERPTSAETPPEPPPS